jgi:hypothetical protein
MTRTARSQASVVSARPASSMTITLKRAPLIKQIRKIAPTQATTYFCICA